MKVLFIVWECDPIIKVGGLGDVAKSLPKALKELGADIRVVIPYYDRIDGKKWGVKKEDNREISYGVKKEKVEVFSIIHPTSGIKVYFLKNQKYLPDAQGHETFAFFDKCVTDIFSGDGPFVPDIYHCNDNHAGLIPLLVKENGMKQKTVLTLHNLAYQGIADLKAAKKLGVSLTGNPVSVNFLREGIMHADRITTVSPSYSKEILDKRYGFGLEKLLGKRKDCLRGILNGIEVTWKDTDRVRMPDSGNWKQVKANNKYCLQERLDLNRGSDIPLISYIGRLDPNQKGIDILYKALNRKIIDGAQFIILGTGDRVYEEYFKKLMLNHPGRVHAYLGFDDELAHEIYGASDFMIIPSRYEPCGLVQMIAMKFGTVPIARKTGGLADSIRHGENGWLFSNYSARELTEIIEKSLEIYKKKQEIHEKIVENTLKTDFSWKKSANEYLELYKKLI